MANFGEQSAELGKVTKWQEPAYHTNFSASFFYVTMSPVTVKSFFEKGVPNTP